MELTAYGDERRGSEYDLLRTYPSTRTGESLVAWATAYCPSQRTGFANSWNVDGRCASAAG